MMIPLHRLNNSAFFLNARQIEMVEGHYDTTITLASERKLIVRESPAQIARLVEDYDRRTRGECTYADGGASVLSSR